MGNGWILDLSLKDKGSWPKAETLIIHYRIDPSLYLFVYYLLFIYVKIIISVDLTDKADNSSVWTI